MSDPQENPAPGLLVAPAAGAEADEAEDARRLVERVLRGAAHTRRASFLAYIVLALLYAASVVAAAAYERVAGHPLDAPYVPAIGLLITAVGAVPPLLVLRRSRAALAEADRLDDVRLVPALLDAMDVHRNVSYIAERILTRLLPRLEPEHAGLLDARRMGQLCRLLARRHTGAGELQLAILQALQQVGDDTVLATVERLAQPQAGPVSRAARESLPAVRQRAAARRAAASLLRPLEVPAAGTLLRPAEGTTDTPPETLLRPAGEPDG